MLQDIDARPINSALQSLVDKIEENSAGVQVLAAQQFQYPVQQSLMEVSVSRLRQVNILEEFALRAGLEINPPPTLSELANVLRLDVIFVEDTVNRLINSQALFLDSAGVLQTTSYGEEFYRQGSVPLPLEKKRIYRLQDCVIGETKFAYKPLSAKVSGIVNLRDFVDIDLGDASSRNLDLSEAQSLLQASGLGLHAPEAGYYVTEIEPRGDSDWAWETVSLFVLYDILNNEIRLQARVQERILLELSEWFEEQLKKRSIDLYSLFNLSEAAIAREREVYTLQQNEIVEQRLAVIRQKSLDQLRSETSGQPLPSDQVGARQLRDAQIRPNFFKALQTAKEQVIIFSPWISESVVDRQFVDLLSSQVSRGVRFLIGYGIAQSEIEEDRPAPPQVLERLQGVSTPDGFPGVVLLWLGNSHAKEVVVDRKIHLSGSHNWLSYRGDRLLRGETIYEVTIPDEVNLAHLHLTQRFVERASEIWNNREKPSRATALHTLGALGLEEKALQWIEQDQAFAQLPLWLALARYAACVGRTSSILTSLNSALDLCLSIPTDSPLVSQVRAGWCNLLGSIVSTDQDAIKFLACISQKLTQLQVIKLASRNFDSSLSELAGKYPCWGCKRKPRKIPSA